MEAVVTDVIDEAEHDNDEQLRLFVVWIETNCGHSTETDWEMNSDPQPLAPALVEAADARKRGFPTKVLLEGFTPRPDGLFSNPRTQP